jgi:hypothetical protein
MELPVVAMSSGAPSMRLLARSVDEYLHRVLATEDLEGQSRALGDAAGEMGAALYQACYPCCNCACRGNMRRL